MFEPMYSHLFVLSTVEFVVHPSRHFDNEIWRGAEARQANRKLEMTI